MVSALLVDRTCAPPEMRRSRKRRGLQSVRMHAADELDPSSITAMILVVAHEYTIIAGGSHEPSTLPYSLSHLDSLCKRQSRDKNPRKAIRISNQMNSMSNETLGRASRFCM